MLTNNELKSILNTWSTLLFTDGNNTKKQVRDQIKYTMEVIDMIENKNIEDLAKFLGLKPGKRYRINKDTRTFTLSKYYNVYFDDETLGVSLSSFTLYELLNIVEVNNN